MRNNWQFPYVQFRETKKFQKNNIEERFSISELSTENMKEKNSHVV